MNLLKTRAPAAALFILLVASVCIGVPRSCIAHPLCVHIYYDATNDPQNRRGLADAQSLQNLLGHFPEFQQIVEPIENYRSGDLERCQVGFYLGSTFENQIPQAFFDDFATTKRQVAWLGYSVWKFGNPRLKQALGFEYQGLTTLDRDHLDGLKRPTFFKDILYRGQTFHKYGEFAQGNPDQFLASYEMTRLGAPSGQAEVLASAVHGSTGESIPYAVRKGNRFFIADIPFSYIHEADRYLVFADLLFDILGISPKNPGHHYASLRLEDVHPCLPSEQLDRFGAIARELDLPFQIALVPIFANPLNADSDCEGTQRISMAQSPNFLAALRRLKTPEVSIVWHGVTHQYESLKNPDTGMSGDDFEFWDAVHSSPVRWDTPSQILDRLLLGWESIAASGFTTDIWETPHYRASALDYRVFSQVFPWSMGRIVYVDHSVSSLPSQVSPGHWLSRTGAAGQEARKNSLKNLQVTPGSSNYVGQFFPYEIYGDLFGQRVLPENLGYPVDYFNESAPYSVDDMLAMARRNYVLRDAWASFFFHAFNLTSEQGAHADAAAPLKKLVQGIRAIGFEFISLDAFTKTHDFPVRKEPILIPQARSRSE